MTSPDYAKPSDDQILDSLGGWAREFPDEALELWRPRYYAAADHAWAARDEEVAELERRLELPITIHGDYVPRAEAIEAASGLIILLKSTPGWKPPYKDEVEAALARWDKWVNHE